MPTNLNKDFSTTELLKNPEYAKAVKAREKAQKRDELSKINKKEDSFGDKVYKQYNPYTAENQGFDKAGIIAEKYDAMMERIEKLLPPDYDALISTQFKNWIAAEKNSMMYDNKLRYDNNYYRVNYDTGELRSDNELMVKQMEVINKKIERLEKAFKTFIKKPDAWADTKTLQTRAKYYEQRAEIIKEAQEQGIDALLEVYSKKVEKGEVNVENVAEKAKENLASIDNKMAAIDKALAETDAMSKKADAPMNPDIEDLTLDQVKSRKM